MNRVRILLLDNNDSFTFNLAQDVGGLGASVEVVASSSISVDEVNARRCDAVILSPGPGRPEGAGISMALVRGACATMPILGVCLGHQAIVAAFGGTIERAHELVHGKTSPVRHDGRGLFCGLPNPFDATRYHSLAARRDTLPAVLMAQAFAPDGTIMAVRHRTRPVHGVQFHPESILTTEGRSLLSNFLTLCTAADRLVS